MIVIKTREEIEIMRESALIVSKTLGLIAKEIKPGVTTLYLDKLAEEFIRDNGAEPAFLGMYGFPNSLCMSPNTQVVHGIPNNTPLVDGDIISVDCGALKNGFYGDHAYTFEVGEVVFTVSLGAKPFTTSKRCELFANIRFRRASALRRALSAVESSSVVLVLITLSFLCGCYNNIYSIVTALSNKKKQPNDEFE